MQPTAVSRAFADAKKGGYVNRHNSDAAHFLDRAFWVALGVTRKWDVDDWHNRQLYHAAGSGGELPNKMTKWSKQWHRFIDAARSRSDH